MLSPTLAALTMAMLLAMRRTYAGQSLVTGVKVQACISRSCRSFNSRSWCSFASYKQKDDDDDDDDDDKEGTNRIAKKVVIAFTHSDDDDCLAW